MEMQQEFLDLINPQYDGDRVKKLNQLLAEKISLTAVDEDDNNILHLIAFTAQLQSNSESYIKEILEVVRLILHNCSVEDLMKLKQDNKNGENAIFKAFELDNLELADLLLKYKFDPNSFLRVTKTSIIDEVTRKGNIEGIKLLLKQPKLDIKFKQAYDIFKLISPTNGLREVFQTKYKRFEIDNFRNALLKEAAQTEQNVFNFKEKYNQLLPNFSREEQEAKTKEINILSRKSEFLLHRLLEEDFKNYDLYNLIKAFHLVETLNNPKYITPDYLSLLDILDDSSSKEPSSYSDEKSEDEWYEYGKFNYAKYANNKVLKAIGDFIVANVQSADSLVTEIIRGIRRNDLNKIYDLLKKDIWLNYSRQISVINDSNDSMISVLSIPLVIKGEVDEENYYDLIDALLDKGANPNITVNNLGRAASLLTVAFEEAIYDNFERVVSLLLQYGADPNYYYNDLNLTLPEAIRVGSGINFLYCDGEEHPIQYLSLDIRVQ